MFLNLNEILAILRVIVLLEAEAISKINLVDIIISLNRFEFITGDDYISLLKRYTKPVNFIKDKEELLHSLLKKMLVLMSFADFNKVLDDAGNRELAKAIIAERYCLTRNWPSKRKLPNAVVVNEYFVNLKRCADCNSFQDGTCYQLGSFISYLGEQLKICRVNERRFQLLVDKRVMVYFLLAQQFSSMRKRLEIMKRMRDSVPQSVDRTLFDTIFHSYMTVIWSIKDDVKSADIHEQRARYASHLCLPGLASIVLRLCVQYKNNIFYFRRHHSEDLEHSTVDFEEIFQMFEHLHDDPPIYGTIAMLEMVHALLGIDWDLNVCNVDNVKPSNIERGKTVLATLKEPAETRRKMLYCLCHARLHEIVEPRKAIEYAREALCLADDGCYYEVEKRNIQNYVETLAAKVIPNAKI